MKGETTRPNPTKTSHPARPSRSSVVLKSGVDSGTAGAGATITVPQRVQEWDPSGTSDAQFEHRVVIAEYLSLTGSSSEMPDPVKG